MRRRPSSEPRRARCRSCGATIYWTRVLASGKKLPIDPIAGGLQTPPRLGNVEVKRRLNEDLDVFELVAVVRREPAPEYYVSHFETCPHAAAHRRPREPQGGRS